MKTNGATGSDRHLVTEQPGMIILLAGIALSVFLGITIKSLLSPARVSAQIEKAASNIHKDIRVQFSSAQMSLADGILPRVAVLITNVRMESESECWGKPVLEVDELRLPFSFVSLIRGQPPLRRVYINAAAINFREDIVPCEAADDRPRLSEGAVSLSPRQVQQKYRNDIRQVRIQNLRVSSRKYPALASEFLGIHAQVKSFEPKHIELRAKTHLLREQRVGEYMSHANIFLEYKESPEKTLQAHVFGNWREGHYSLISNYSMEDEFMVLESDLKHIPLSQIINVLKRYDLMKSDLVSRQIWLSSKARLAAPVREFSRTTPLEIRDVRLEGDIGEIYSERIQFQSLEPLKYSPIYIDMRKLDVAKMLELFKLTPTASFLGNLGVFRGGVEIRTGGEAVAQGELSGLEFLFANKGKSESQIIDRLSIDTSFKNDQLFVNVSRIIPRGGLLAGDLRLNHNFLTDKMELRLNIDDLNLGRNVQDLMTNGLGSIGSVMVASEASFIKGILTHLKGELQVSSMMVEGVSFEKTKVLAQKSSSSENVVLNAKVAELRVGAASPATEVLQVVTRAEWWQEGQLKFNSVTGKFELGSQGELAWKNLSAIVFDNQKFSTSGAWNLESQLEGSVSVIHGKNTERWKILGDRENPRFEKEKPDQ